MFMLFLCLILVLFPCLFVKVIDVYVRNFLRIYLVSTKEKKACLLILKLLVLCLVIVLFFD